MAKTSKRIEQQEQIKQWVEEKQFYYGSIGEKYSTAASLIHCQLGLKVSARTISKYADKNIWSGGHVGMGDCLVPYKERQWTTLRFRIYKVLEAAELIPRVENNKDTYCRAIAIALAANGWYYPLGNIQEMLNVMRLK